MNTPRLNNSGNMIQEESDSTPLIQPELIPTGEIENKSSTDNLITETSETDQQSTRLENITNVSIGTPNDTNNSQDLDKKDSINSLSSSTSDNSGASSLVAIHHADVSNEFIIDEEGNKDDPQAALEKQIINAAQRGDVEFLKQHINSSSDKSNSISPNLTDSDGITLVHWASLNNKLSTVKYLVSMGANPDVSSGDMNATPLLWAVRYGLVYIADFLVRDAKVNVHAVDKNGINILLASVFSSNVMMVIYSIWALSDNRGEDGDIRHVGLDGIDFTDPMGRTALHWAAYQGDFLTVDVLLNAGAKVDLIDADGFTPLHWALCNGSKAVISSLLDAQCNVNLKTNDGKSCWDIARDMNCSTMWNHVLKDHNLDPITGIKRDLYVTTEWANFLIFILPYITLPLVLYILSLNFSVFIKILILALVIVLQQITLKQILIPSLRKGKINLMRTPFFAGVFTSTAYWCIIIWLLRILPDTISKHGLSNVLFLMASTGTIYFFVQSSNTDPGYIPKEEKVENIQEIIFSLLKEKLFDSNNYCIYSNIRKPLRSKFSREKKLNIARFDHYCPWVNNNIGVRNHKSFFLFTSFLELAIVLWLNLTLNYFNDLTIPNGKFEMCHYLPHDLCSGFLLSKFMFYFLCWVSLQLFWLTILLVVQSTQISKGSTTHEFSHKYKHMRQEDIFSSVPADDSLNILINNSRNEEVENSIYEGDTDTDSESLEEIETNVFLSLLSNVSQRLKNSKYITFPVILLTKLLASKVCRMVGFDQMVIITNDLMQRRKREVPKEMYNYGFSTNWKDFLFLVKPGDHYSIHTLMSLPVEGESNLNGVLVDYYRLYHKPESV